MTTITDSSSWTSLQARLAAADTNADGIVSKSELTDAASEDTNLTTDIVAAADTDGDGALSQVEFTSFASTFNATTGLSLLSAQEDTSSVASLFASADTDGSATLTSTELAAALTATAASEDDTASTDTTTADSTTTSDTTTVSADVQAALDTVDATGDGVFDSRDVAKGVLQAASDASEKQSLKTVKSADTNGDGTVSATEAAAALLA